MRPVRLELQGFTCYRDKQKIDFTPLSLFAIAGPTGAGKSSILDAMAFALYGKVPRLGGQNLDEFISLGAARASVLFDFDTQGERYRVLRSIPRTGAKKAQFEQVSDGVQRALCDGVDAVNDKVKALLGLDYNAFIQSVLLPQGEFARFLKSTPGDQRKILRELLRLGIYERMRERAATQTRELSLRIKADREMLEGPYAGATRERVEALERDLNELSIKKNLAVKEEAELSRQVEVTKKQWDLSRERRDRNDTLHRLRGQEPEIDKLTNTVERAKQGGLVVPLLDQAKAKLDAWTRLDRKLADLQRNMEAAVKSAWEATAQLNAAEQKMKRLPEKRQRVTQLTAIRPVIELRTKLTKRHAAARSELVKTEQAITCAKATLEQERKAEDSSEARRELLTKQRADLGYDATIHEIFKRANRLAYDVGEERKKVADLNPAAAQEQMEAAEAALRKAEEELRIAQAEQAAAEQRLEAAEAAYEAAQDQNRAAVLRMHLTQGCTCPVCEQPVGQVPTSLPSADMVKANAAIGLAKRSREAVVKKVTHARDRFSRASADAEHARTNLAQREEQASACRRKIDRFTENLVKNIQPFECSQGEWIEQFVQRQFDHYDRLRATWQDLNEKLNTSELECQKTQFAREATERRIETEQNNLLRLSGEIADAEGQLAEYDSQIQSISSRDPEKELKSIQTEIDETEKEHQHAAAMLDRADAQLRNTEIDVSAARARLLSAGQERDESQTIAHNALYHAGFADEMDLRQALLEPAVMAKGEREIEVFRRNLYQTIDRLQELDAQLEGVNLTEADVHRETEKHEAARQLVRCLERRIGEQSNALLQLKEATAKAEDLRAQHATRISRFTVMQQLSNDLKGECFQRYLLEGSFKRLVDGASLRLRELNERYALTLIESKFAVIDHDHGSQHRLADTLSGGETFLVSLALALELSEQIQRAVGAVRLDSLFIDEGFGTLDPETLDTVADAIESLSKTNRMVGVVTHVAELHRRLPRLEVRRGPAGSIVEYVED